MSYLRHFEHVGHRRHVWHACDLKIVEGHRQVREPRHRLRESAHAAGRHVGHFVEPVEWARDKRKRAVECAAGATEGAIEKA